MNEIKDHSKDNGNDMEKLSQEKLTIEEQMINAFQEIFDPEIPVDIYNLGLIYGIELTQKEGKDHYIIHMTLTSPACPVAGSLVEQVQQAALGIKGVVSAKVKLTFTPPWTVERVSEEGKLIMEMEGAHILKNTPKS